MPLKNSRPDTFGRWLIAQRDRGDGVIQLTEAARGGAAFPEDGGREDVRRWLRETGAKDHMLEALDDACAEWRFA